MNIYSQLTIGEGYRHSLQPRTFSNYLEFNGYVDCWVNIQLKPSKKCQITSWSVTSIRINGKNWHSILPKLALFLFRLEVIYELMRTRFYIGILKTMSKSTNNKYTKIYLIINYGSGLWLWAGLKNTIWKSKSNYNIVLR